MSATSSLPDDLVRSASLYFEGLSTPLSLSAAVMLRNGEWDGLARLSADPRRYNDPQRYARDNAACALLKKLQQLPTVTDRKSAAMLKWWEGERDCYRSNERLTPYTRGNRNSSDRVRGIDDFLSSVRKIILSWIGPCPPQLAEGRHGPGATLTDRGRNTTVPDKMSSNPSLTRDAIWYLPQWLGNQWGASFAQRHGEFSWSRGNRFTTVPKTALIDRCIAAEPSINVFYQLALGRVLRRRLRNAGWDLDLAQDIHRQVACESSVTSEYATLDLSNASDTVCTTLVEVVLPPLWFDALNDLRSKFTFVDGHWVRLEKFSSMGNGFTFELETIIFAAVACAATRQGGCEGILGKDVFVFGDDIIVPTRCYEFVEPVLRFCGFKLNAEKSYFGNEPFRESCGGDYFAGKPVRGYYLKQLPSNPQDTIAFANGLFAMAKRLGLSGFDLPPKARFSVMDQLPTSIRRCRGPQALGDTVLWEDDMSRWDIRVRSSIRYIRALRPWKMRVIPFSIFDGPVVLACATYGTGNYQDGVIPRDGVIGYKVGWIPWS
uniref:RNA-directed RNA polymerase n=1 Tax=Leviviridae sp. TaxID=2027243 RepID=A0A514DC96_9VIRU|nr:MAG: RNA-dependent RNA polymerase [Leviviridae sp.]